MNLMFMTVDEARYYRDSQTILADKIINAVKEYFKKNTRLIAAGLMGSNGTCTHTYLSK